MAKRTAAPPERKPDEVDTLLIELASTVLSDHFFDPDREQQYKALLSAAKRSDTDSAVLEEYAMDLPEGECSVRLEALKAWTTFRVRFSGDGFNTVTEGTWSFEREELRPAIVVTRTGKRDLIESAAENLMDELAGLDLSEEEAESMRALLEDDEDSPPPLIGDDPKEPPPPSGMERNRIKAIAKRMARLPEPEIGPEDRGWLEQMPQTLPVITDNLIAAAAETGAKRDDNLVLAYQRLLPLQLELVRYRRDRGWAWAARMLDDYQDRLIAVGAAKTIPSEDWFMMAAALSEARVPVSDEVQTKLAEAGFKDEEPGAPEELLRALRGFLGELSDMVSSPFEVMETVKNSGAMMPATLRSFIATELSLSPHAVLRDAVPLILLDGDTTVRRDAAAALEQTASPETLSPDALRRTIAVRNWIPPADRPAVDSAVRKARLAGVETGAWPRPMADIEFHATMVDGSGAQSILGISRSGKKGLFAGLLLRHGTGVVDAWVEEDLPRAKLSRLLKEALLGAIFTRVEKPFVDVVAQHAIAAGTASGTLPPSALLWAAERVGGSEWQDRGLDVTAEAERLFEGLEAGDRTEAGIEALHERGLKWMTNDPIMLSWFEDGPSVREALKDVQRDDRDALLDVTLNQILAPNRMAWAERFLLMALWSQGSTETKYRNRARELVVVAHALAGGEPLGAIPIMALIALQTVREALEGGW